MIQLYTLMWIMAVFFGIVGFMRGWNREVIGTAGIMLGMFALFQFDPLIRGSLLLSFPRQQAFLIQASLFLLIVFFAYQNNLIDDDPENRDLQDGVLGVVVGFINGYLIGGTLWYFIDINEYPLDPWIVAPAPGSPSAEMLNTIPLVLLSGGPAGSGEFLLVAVVVLFLIALIIL